MLAYNFLYITMTLLIRGYAGAYSHHSYLYSLIGIEKRNVYCYNETETLDLDMEQGEE